MLTEKQTTHEYLHHLVNRAQGQQLRAKAGTGEDRAEEILNELNELSGIIHKAYMHVLAATAIRIGRGAEDDEHGNREAATG